MTELEIRCIQSLSANAQDWRCLTAQMNNGGSPFYCRQFFSVLCKHRTDVYFGIVKASGNIVSILPFQHDGSGVAFPAGFPMADYQGFIGEPVNPKILSLLLKKAGVREFHFNHVPASQSAFLTSTQRVAGSPIIDTRISFLEYCQELKQRGSEYSQAMRKLRSLERDHGEIGFEPLSRDHRILNQVIEWKSQQYQSTGARDMFQQTWFRSVVEGTFEYDAGDFIGALSVLRAGGRPVAIHYGLIAGKIWHYWFPAYDPEFSKYSPGINLLLLMIQHAGPAGIEMIDLGKGQNVRYKEALKNDEIPLAEGSFCRPSIRFYWRKFKQSLRGLRGILR